MKFLVAIIVAVVALAVAAEAEAGHRRALRQQRRQNFLHAVTHPFGGALRGGCGNGACR